MVQKKRRITAGKQYLIGLIAVVGIISALWCQSLVSLADSNGTVTADSANIRKQADASSEVIGSASRGNTVAIINEVQDSSGTLWYEVYVNANTTGYIRSDLVEKQGGGTSQNTSGDTQTTASSGASGASVEPETILDAQYAVVSPEVIMVRTAPSTNEGVVDRLNKGAQVIVSGETQGNDGKKWYYVTFTGTGDAERSGFIRSDLLSLGDMVPVPEEEEPEPQETEPEPEPTVNRDYEVVYGQNPDGSSEWFLYDYTVGEKPDKYRLAQLMEATKARSEIAAADAKTLVRQRVAIVILVILVVILIVVGVIMALKLRDVYYEEYEDEEEEEETPAPRKRRSEEEEAPTQRRRRSEEEEAPAQRRRRTEGNDEASERRRRRTEEEEPSSRRRKRMEEEESADERSARRRAARDDRESRVREVEYREDEAGSAAVKSASKRKAKNFLLDDDEFEFEFLNMDDKNL
ncbi:MAG: SH3 domain-containing protein [Lachnospiraceae bacterium]|nr:SH3 domain-containing protein [Lachnospiraceae bacterium]